MAHHILRCWSCEHDEVDARLEALNKPEHPDHTWKHDTKSKEAKQVAELGRARLVCVCLATARAEKAAKADAITLEETVKAAVDAKVAAAVKAARAERAAEAKESVSPKSETPGGAGGKAPSKAAASKAKKPTAKKKK